MTRYSYNSYHYSFNADLSSWDTSSVTDMTGAFYWARYFNSTLEAWDVSRVTSMERMFYYCDSFNSPLNWDTSGVTSMEWMFYYCDSFNSPLNWDTSSVTSMEYMFTNCKRFDSPLNWDTSRVTSMEYMFSGCDSFNSPLNWDTSSVTSMEYMFDSAFSFKSPSITSWDVRQVKSMQGMFYMYNYYYFYYNDDAALASEYFNVDISAWNVASVTNFNNMFSTSGSSTMNQILCWDLSLSNHISVVNMFGSDGTYMIDPTAAKCACEVNEFYDGTGCAACAPGSISFGKTESCMNCTDFLCPPSPSPTVSVIPSVTPLPTATPEPSAHPTPTPTMDPTMVQVTKISSSYVSTPAVRTEILHAEEIILNGVEFSSSSRRLTADSEVLSNLVEEVQRGKEAIMAHIDAQRTIIEILRTTNDALQAKHDALQAKVDAQQAKHDDLQAKVDSHETSIAELKVRR